MSTEQTPNLCNLHGCPNACCVDMEFQYPIKLTDIKRAFPGAKRVNLIQFDFLDLSDGVYYLRTILGKNGWAKIVGECPRLDNGNCSIYESDARPAPCKGFVKSSKACSFAWREAKRLLKENELLL